MKRRFLLLADLPPCLNYTGGLVLDSLVRQFDESEIYVVTILNPDINDATVAPDLRVPHTFLKKPRENGASKFRSMAPTFSSFLYETYAHFVAVPRLAMQVAKICREQQITDIWCVLQGQTMVRLANAVAEKTGLSIYTQVWDSIGWWLRSHKVDRIWSKIIRNHYDQAIGRSRGFAAASLPMAADYQRIYGVSSVPVMHALPLAWLEQNAHAASGGDLVRIALSGQLYARQEFDLLMLALEKINWRIGSKSVEVHVFGRQFSMITSRPANVVFRGWCAQEDLISTLSQFDLLYCPYWFDPAFEEEARSSFPSKVTTYFASGRPVLFHGPAYSSVAKLFDEKDCGIICTSMDESALLSALRLALDADRAACVVKNSEQVFRDLFSTEAQARSFAEFLKIPLRQKNAE